MSEVTLVRYDEIGLKGKNRRFFEGRLRRNVARALEVTPGAVSRDRGRLFVERRGGEVSAQEAERRLSRIFGIRSFSPAERVAADEAAITAEVLVRSDRAVARGAASFAIESRRSHKDFPLTSLQLNVRLGRAVQDRHARLRVDLARPESKLHVEVRREAAYVYDRVVPGPGGLPVGSAGRALLLLSGGIDSPVAGWMALKRGLALDSVHFHAFPYTAQAAQERAVAVARELARWRGQGARVHLVPVTAAQQAFARLAPERLWTLLLRRAMLRTAAALARRHGHGALVTGDSLGQVASQTLENLAAADRGLDLPVLRPLVGFDKAEIVERARRIGTFTLSIQPFDDCCVLFAPRRPETRARPEEIARAESALPLDELVEGALADARIVELEPRPESYAAEVSPAATRAKRTRAMRIPSSSSTVNR
ncbi:MAG: tRNA uracil 4-sulfurtransferase ThiI [Gemmatimonadota bacterium]